MRILWYSNAPWCGSGYGTQSALVVRKLIDMGHEVAVAAFHGLQGVPLNWEGLTVYPGSAEDSWAQDVMLGHYQRFGADLMITLMDAWVLDHGQLNYCQQNGMRIAFWQPVDCQPLGALDLSVLRDTGIRPIAMSRFGERQLKEFSPWYIPHAVDTEFWKPDPEKAARSREKGGFADKFVVGMNAANQDPVRKAFGEQLAAFRLFVDDHPDALMLINTRKATRQGVNFERLIEVTGLREYVQFSDQYLIAAGLTSAAEIAQWYNALDVLTNASYGEGFGLPALEAQACGTPVILADNSASAEMCGSGWLVPTQPYWNSGHSSWWGTPQVKGLLDAYEAAYQQRGSQELRDKAREFALQYDINTVAEKYWKPFLEEALTPVVVLADGLKWCVGGQEDHGDRLGPQHEETVEGKVLDLLPQDGVFLDVGAHVGHYALRAAARCSQVIAVEPNPATASRLRENLDLNEIKNVEVLEVAAWDSMTRLRLESPTGHERDGSTSVKPDDEGVVMGTPLDDVLEPGQAVDVIKLDVEGADLHALRGMRRILAESKPVMVIEDHSVYGCYDKADLETLLADLGYGVRDFAMYGCAPYLLAEPLAS